MLTAETETLELDNRRPPVCEADVQALEAEMLKHPQADCPVVHRFAPGLYIRELTIPADTYVIGHRQTTYHLNIMLAGRIILTEARQLEGDMLIKGGYTQSRLRQMIFGGATSEILAHAELPVLMAH